MYTSYFAKNAKNPNAVSICGKVPDWYKGRQYKKLAPKWSFFQVWKQTGDNEYYITHFIAEVLDKLDARTVYEELGENTILLCYESSEKFCHRFLVAAWFYVELGIEIKELDTETQSYKQYVKYFIK